MVCRQRGPGASARPRSRCSRAAFRPGMRSSRRRPSGRAFRGGRRGWSG
ncbi:hypothetical protein ACFPRL_30600 [Pseudoclavibacter helvolus]